MSQPTQEQIEEAIREEHEFGYVNVECSECGEVRQIEPDADYACWEDDCGGRVVSPLRAAGLI